MLVMIQLASKLVTFFANKSELWTVNSLVIAADKIGTKNFKRLYFGVPVTDKMGQNEGLSSIIDLCALALL